jgi:isoquinoline 1-oxidoreductase alpha subunit
MLKIIIYLVIKKEQFLQQFQELKLTIPGYHFSIVFFLSLLFKSKWKSMATINLSVNGKSLVVDADPQTPVLWVLRDHLNLVGTKYGCGIAQCGACTILVDGKAVRSCSLKVSQVGEKSITTIEGLSESGDHPVQRAWIEQDVAQCGYCQTGQIMNAVSLLKSNPNPTDEEIETAMQGNICRCGTYLRIRKAIKTAAKSL